MDEIFSKEKISPTTLDYVCGSIQKRGVLTGVLTAVMDRRSLLIKDYHHFPELSNTPMIRMTGAYC